MSSTESQIRISVVVPTYRRQTLLNNCIKALDAQSLARSSYEIIIVSDGPDNVTREAVGKWIDGRNMNLHYLHTPVKMGPAAARNAGWRHARGKLIAFTDDDCLPDPGWLAYILAAYQDENEIAFSGRIIVPLNKEPSDFERNTQGLETAGFLTANCACTKNALIKVNGFDERFHMAWREDSDLEFTLLQHQVPIKRINNAVVVHPVRKAAWGISIKEQKKGMFNALLYKKYPQLYRQKIQGGPAWNYYAMIALLFIAIVGLATKTGAITGAALLGWTALMAGFIFKRLSNTSRKWKHVLEIIVTSAAIPFLSVFWQLYGSWKYRVFFM